MTIVEILLLAVSLSFDTFAVSLSCGVSTAFIERKRFIIVVTTFALTQTCFTVGGWLFGAGVVSYIGGIDHWVAFVLLCYVGGKMIWENRGHSSRSGNGYCDVEGGSVEGRDKKKIDIKNNRTLITLSIATSIDALAVGISLAMIAMSEFKVCFLFISIAIVTAMAAIVGLKSGSKIGVRMGNRASIIGGIILIAIGVKILVEHTGLF